MAKKISQNVDGRFYVDIHCINCSLCAAIAPDIFATNHDDGHEYIIKQPQNKTELTLVKEMIGLCPASAIQDNE